MAEQEQVGSIRCAALNSTITKTTCSHTQKLGRFPLCLKCDAPGRSTDKLDEMAHKVDDIISRAKSRHSKPLSPRTTTKKGTMEKQKRHYTKRSTNPIKPEDGVVEHIDFRLYPEIYKNICDLAKKNYRTVQSEIIYQLSKIPPTK